MLIICDITTFDRFNFTSDLHVFCTCCTAFIIANFIIKIYKAYMHRRKDFRIEKNYYNITSLKKQRNMRNHEKSQK